MKLAVDARLMAEHPRGMGQYTRTLVEPVETLITALLPRNQKTQKWNSCSDGAAFFPWWEQCVLPQMVRHCGATHLLCPSNTGPLTQLRGVKKILVVHDLIYLQPFAKLSASRSLYQNLGRLYRRAVVPTVVRKTDVLVTVSEYTREKLCSFFGIDRNGVHVIPNSVGSEWFVRQPLEDSQRKPYLLSVTGEAPSKNVPALLQAFAKMRTKGVGCEMSLRVVGIKPTFHRAFLAETERLGLAGVVQFESFVSEDNLRRMFREAWAFVLPSLFEGFGIPIIEAMASGTPVACSNATSLPEVAGGAAVLFNPLCAEDIAAKLSMIVEERVDRPKRILRGLTRAEMFRRETVMKKITRFWNHLS